jgi:hypothetical protein
MSVVAEGLQNQIDRLRFLSVPAAGVGLGLSALLAFAIPYSMLAAYLTAYMFWFGLSLGCLALTVLHHLVGGNWGQPVRRLLEIGAVVLVPMVLLFLPILIGRAYIYPWANSEVAASSELIQYKRDVLGFLGGSKFALRAAIGFGFWVILALWCYSNSLKCDQVDDDRDVPASPRPIERISGLLMAAVFFTGTFAAIDWDMTREPEWYSSIYGPMVLLGWGLEAFAFTIIVATLLRDRSPEMATVATTSRMHDLGNLMLAFTLLWAYTSFSQLLIIWMGNLNEEAPWYVRRATGGWQYVVAALIIFHFFVPFFCLLFRSVKRTPRYLMSVAAFILAMHLLDLAWLTIPANAKWAGVGESAGHSEHAENLYYALSIIDLGLVLLAFVGIGGVWLFSFLWLLRDKPVVIRSALTHPPGRDYLPSGDLA